MRVLIVAGGLEPSMELMQKTSDKADYIIGVDKGCNYLLRHNIIPQYIMGDFDSIDSEKLKLLIDKGVNKKKFNKEKDFTDTEEAFEFAINELKATEIYLLGGTGRRLDHFLGNMGLLKRALDKNVKAFMLDHYNEIYLINEPQVINGMKGGYVSFQAYSEYVKNFTIKNAKYELKDYSLSFGDPLTISNEFLDGPIVVTFESGIVIVIKSCD